MLNKEAKEDDILAKHKELRDLKDQMSEKRLLHRLALRKQFPELGSGFGYGPGMGQGRGWHRGSRLRHGPQGQGDGRGFGQGGGYCWR